MANEEIIKSETIGDVAKGVASYTKDQAVDLLTGNIQPLKDYYYTPIMGEKYTAELVKSADALKKGEFVETVYAEGRALKEIGGRIADLATAQLEWQKDAIKKFDSVRGIPPEETAKREKADEAARHGDLQPSIDLTKEMLGQAVDKVKGVFKGLTIQEHDEQPKSGLSNEVARKPETGKSSKGKEG